MSYSHGGPNNPVAPDAAERLAMLEAWLLEKGQMDMRNARKLESMVERLIVLSNENTAKLNERLDELDNMVSQLIREVSKMAESVTVLSGEVAGLTNRLSRAESVNSQSQRLSSHAAGPSMKRTSSAMQEEPRKRNRASPTETPQSRETHPHDSGNTSTSGAWKSNAAIRTPQSEMIHSRSNESSNRPDVKDRSDAGEMLGSRPTSKAQFVWPEPLSEPGFGPFDKPAGSFSLEDGLVAAPKPLMPPPPTM